MKTFMQWIESVSKTTNNLAMLVQQGVGGGDKTSWMAILKMVKDGDHLAELKSLASGYLKSPGKAGSAANYLMKTIDERESQEEDEHHEEKASRGVNDMAEVLFRHHIPQELADELMDNIEKAAKDKQLVMGRHTLGGGLMKQLMPILVKIAEHLLSREERKSAKDAMIEICGMLTHWSENVPTPEMIFNRV